MEQASGEMVSDTSLLGVPLMVSNARRLVLKMFKHKTQWRRKDLAVEVSKMHVSMGGISGQQNPQRIVKKVLSMLLKENAVIRVSFGTWRIVGSEPIQTSCAIKDVADRIVGIGSGSVYCYFNPSDKELADIKGELSWPCKIGMTDGPVLDRIMEQGVRTAFSKPPRVGIIIKSDFPKTIERALHSALRIANASIRSAPGSEWFETSPEAVARWYELFVSSVGVLNTQK